MGYIFEGLESLSKLSGVCESLRQMGYTFEGLESLSKLSGVCESVWIISLSVRNCISQDHRMVVKKKKLLLKSQRTHFLSVSTARVSAIGYSKGRTPLLDVRKSCVPSCCFFSPYIICQVFAFVTSLWILKGFSVRTLCIYIYICTGLPLTFWKKEIFLIFFNLRSFLVMFVFSPFLCMVLKLYVDPF